MNPQGRIPSCARMDVTRRHFITRCAACIGAAGFAGIPILSPAADSAKKMRIRIVHALHSAVQAVPDWPNKGYDFRRPMEKIHNVLTKKCGGMEFTSSMAKDAEQAKAILEEDKTSGVDGYVVYQMNCWNQVVQTLATSGKPVIYADWQFAGSGGFLVYTAGFLRQHAPNVAFVPSSRLDDLVDAVKCFRLVKEGRSVQDFVAAVTETRKENTPRAGRLACKNDPVKTLEPEACIQRLKKSRIIAVQDQNARDGGSIAGIPVEFVPFAEVNEAWKSADKEEAAAVGQRWSATAKSVVGVSRETLETSAAMYLGMKQVLEKHGANAITVNCLGGFYGGHIHAYPCLGFHELNNEGLVGGCECDVRSAASMVLFSALTGGRPGYISDPVMDSAKRQIIYAHCVASNRVFGPEGQRSPFHIMTHSEDRQGASVRCNLPLGYMTTSIQLKNETKEILFHRAKAVENDPDDRACRTKLGAAPIGDFEKLFTEWDGWGWHRVTCYGDLKEPVFALAQAMGWRVVEEA